MIFPDRGIAVDGAGDIFVGNLNQDGFGDTMVEVPAGCVQAACVKQLPGKHDGVWGVAVDGAGNVFVADVSQPGQITEIPATAGYTTAKTLTGNFGLVQALAVDGSGNVFVSDFTRRRNQGNDGGKRLRDRNDSGERIYEPGRGGSRRKR